MENLSLPKRPVRTGRSLKCCVFGSDELSEYLPVWMWWDREGATLVCCYKWIAIFIFSLDFGLICHNITVLQLIYIYSLPILTVKLIVNLPL